ncbi:nitroreductase/quinone reductase family protein [Nocardiopsis trehalosi]|uniref:nitroreductase/quinone reductase family protein n=1 Tax=Nocardiopsis trehalosi TaxID=109329 RepID=UPI00373FDDD5
MAAPPCLESTLSTTTDFNQNVITEFRANEGRVGGPFEGADLVLLTTTGARSGAQHTAPLVRLYDGDRTLVVASAAGAPQHPAWYHNLLAHPTVTVETGTEQYQAVAVPAEGAERDRLFALVCAQQPGYADYQERTDRVIPVVVLERVAYGADGPPATDLAAKLVEIHTWLRGQVARVREEADAHFAARAAAGDGAPPAPGLGLQIRQHCLAFCEGLHFHHTAEDGHLFPDLERRHPELGEAIDRLRAEHVTVERIRGELVELLADIGTADPERFRDELDRLSTELTAHLDYEEEQLIPVLATIPFPPPAADAS